MQNHARSMNTLLNKTLTAPFVYLSFMAGLALFTLTGPVYAVVEIAEFSQPEYEARYKELIAELRCPKCQNQNLLDSDAPIAEDLRRKTRSLINQGKTNEQVKAFMLDRYGDFVLYKPRFTAATAFLWLGPFVLLLLIIVLLVRKIKHKQEQEMFLPSQANDEATRIKVRNLMSNTPSLNRDNSESDNSTPNK